MKHIAILAALAFAACTPAAEESSPPPPAQMPDVAAAAATPASSDALTSQGWGPLKIGMTKNEVVAALGPDANPNAVGGPDPDTCDEYRPEQAPEGILVMIESGKLARVSLIEMSKLKTANGIGLGDPADTVKAQFGDLAQVTPHKYQDAPAEYITVWDGGKRTSAYVEDPEARGIVFEIDGTGHVGAIRAGGPAIQYVEGCA